MALRSRADPLRLRSGQRTGDAAPAEVTLALAAAVFVGGLVAVQGRVNGAFAVRLGSPVATALVSFGVGTVAVAVLVATSARTRHALTLWRPRHEPVRWWYCIGGAGGAVLVSMTAFAVPLIGVALVAVGVVAGQTVGGLLVDRVGLGPGARRGLTWPRLVGATGAVAALGFAAVGRADGDFQPVLFLGIAVAGFLVAGQQAVNGRLQRATGEARVAALVSFAGGTVVLAALTGVLALTGALPPLHWPALSPLWLGGLGGAAYITVAAAVVPLVGVLRLSLATVAGQLIGGLLLDVFVPAHGRRPESTTVLATLVTLAAVAATGYPGRGRR